MFHEVLPPRDVPAFRLLLQGAPFEEICFSFLADPDADDVDEAELQTSIQPIPALALVQPLGGERYAPRPPVRKDVRARCSSMLEEVDHAEGLGFLAGGGEDLGDVPVGLAERVAVG